MLNPFKKLIGSFFKTGDIASRNKKQEANTSGGPINQVNGDNNSTGNTYVNNKYESQKDTKPVLSEQAKGIIKQARALRQDTLLWAGDELRTLGITRADCNSINITNADTIFDDLVVLESAGYLNRLKHNDKSGMIRKYQITPKGFCFDKDEAATLSEQAQSILRQIQNKNATKIMVLCTGEIIFYPELGGNGEPLDIVDASQVSNDIASLELNGLLSRCPDRATGVTDYAITAEGRLHGNS